MDGLIWFAVVVGLVGVAIELIGGLTLPLLTIGAWAAAHRKGK